MKAPEKKTLFQLLSLRSQSGCFCQRDYKVIHRGLFDPGRVAKFGWGLLMSVCGEHDKRDAVLTQFARDLRAGLITESNIDHSQVRRVPFQPCCRVRTGV